MGSYQRSRGSRPFDGRVRRFVVRDASMEPTLTEGYGLVGVRTHTVRVGQLRVFEHPSRPDFWLVKRVAQRVGEGRMLVSSDNPSVTIADSRHFGSLPIEGSYRVVARIPPVLMG